ncbi:MAG: hypothetical protein F6K42_31145, partial [Leptolyngbya sp. SIO1D8]|nr:hypothetical protein [Leptolyngbya sp. SIO1D8]
TLQPFTGIPVEAVANQASEGVRRLHRYSEDFRDKASVIVGQGLIQGWGAARVATALRTELGVAKGKAETLARTEVMSALNQSAIARYQQNGIGHFQWWISPSEGLCQFCASRNGNVYKVEDAIIPAHPRCRCFAAPYRLEWQQKGLTDDAFAAQYRQEGLEQLEKNGLKPNNGLTPFERAAKLDNPPQLVWKPGDSVVLRSQPPELEPEPEPPEPAPQNQQGSTAAQFVKQEELNALRSRLVETVGSELVDRAEVNLQKLFNENTVGIRVKPETVNLILEGGRFKTKFDLEAERREALRNNPAPEPIDPDDLFFDDLEGEEDEELEALADYNQKRRQVESLILNGMDDIAVEQRPVYGYVQDKHTDYDGPATYGTVIFEIKADVKERSTLLGNDSWYGGFASEATAPNVASLLGGSEALSLDESSGQERIRQTLEEVANAENIQDLLGARSGYLEVQMHEQLTLSDVSSIVFTNGEQPNPETRRLAEENGIEIIVR